MFTSADRVRAHALGVMVAESPRAAPRANRALASANALVDELVETVARVRASRDQFHLRWVIAMGCWFGTIVAWLVREIVR